MECSSAHPGKSSAPSEELNGEMLLLEVSCRENRASSVCPAGLLRIFAECRWSGRSMRKLLPVAKQRKPNVANKRNWEEIILTKLPDQCYYGTEDVKCHLSIVTDYKSTRYSDMIKTSNFTCKKIHTRIQSINNRLTTTQNQEPNLKQLD